MKKIFVLFALSSVILLSGCNSHVPITDNHKPTLSDSALEAAPTPVPTPTPTAAPSTKKPSTPTVQPAKPTAPQYERIKPSEYDLDVSVIQNNIPNDFTSISGINIAKTEIYNQYINSISSRMYDLSSGKITINDTTMIFSAKQIGKPDKNGYPLFIAFHGGGSENNEALADEQYIIMSDYYQNYGIENGLYVVVRSLKARYDEHYLPESFLFYDRIIEDAIAFYNADPNRIYITGFSSGGDGVYAISTQYADRLAAANMSAGTPGILRVENLYNLPICLQMGEDDNAYNRNILAADYDGLLDFLNQRYGGGYIHDTYIHAGGTHNENWSDISTTSQKVVAPDSIYAWKKDRSLASYTYRNTSTYQWLKKYKRNPIPQRVVWSTNEYAGLRRSKAFYWLDRDGILDGIVTASYDKANNQINIEQCTSSNGKLKIYLNPDMLDVFSEVSVNVLGNIVKVRPIVSKQIMDYTMNARGDTNYIFTSEIDITFDLENGTAIVEAVGIAEDNYDAFGSENLLKWNENGVFCPNQNLFNITYEELVHKLNVALPPLDKWIYWGDNLYWTSITMGENSVIFLFQNNRIKYIYSEKEGTIPPSFELAVKERLGTLVTYNGKVIARHDTANMGLGRTCSYVFYDNIYDDKHHIHQRYEYYEP